MNDGSSAVPYFLMVKKDVNKAGNKDEEIMPGNQPKVIEDVLRRSHLLYSRLS